LKCTTRLKKNNESKRKKTKGKLYIFYGKNCLHGRESEKLRLFRRYCEGTGKRKQEKIIKKEISN